MKDNLLRCQTQEYISSLTISGTNIYAGSTSSGYVWKRPLSDIIPPSLTLSLSSTNVTCNGSCNGTATVSVSGGTAPYVYLWSDSSSTATTTGLCAGTYAVVVTDAASNTASGTVTISQSTAIYVTLTTQNPTTNGGSDGSITSSVIGGTPPYSYIWSTGATTANIYQLPSGMYTLTVYDANNCSNYSTIQLVDSQYTTCQAYFYSYADSMNVPPMQQYNFVDQSIPDSTSTITTYLWNFGDGSSSNASNPNHVFSNGTHTICLLITTSSGCSSSYCETITVGNTGCQLYANITTQSPTIIGGNDGSIETTVSGGTPPYAYSWNTGQTTANIYNLTSGLYTLNVIDANGCYNSFTAELYEPYDTTGGNIVDTLYTGILDSCLNFVPDSFYIASITTDPNSYTVSVVWVFVGGGQTATFTVTYTFSQYGNTLVIITLNCETKTLTTYQSYINITSTSSVPEYGNENNAFVYPVPFSNKLNIDFTTQKPENVNIFLIDASGRVLISQKVNSISGANNTEINTTQLSSGVYILNIETSNGIIRKQIVK